SLRWGWAEERERIRAEILEERYRFAPLRRITLQGGEEIDLWCARDALVLKCLALVLGRRLPLSRRCCHLKGHGGAKGAVRSVLAALAQSRFVLKTDVRRYYDSIDHQLLLERLQRLIGDRFVLNLLTQDLMRTSERGGIFRDYRRGIPLGAALSPVIGAFFLTELDRAFERRGLFYLRFMDDVVVLAPSRWKLRRAVAALNGVLDALGLEKHPDKTFIGRVERGFDFLGYCLSPAGLGISRPTVLAFLERAIRLYEQEREAPSLGASRLGSYVHRWLSWAEAGVPPLGREAGR
ncbi:MAG: reverse transcriptase domain-containing protein, partial [bacterium]